MYMVLSQRKSTIEQQFVSVCDNDTIKNIQLLIPIIRNIDHINSSNRIFYSLLCAYKTGYYELIKLLIENNADVNIKSKTKKHL